MRKNMKSPLPSRGRAREGVESPKQNISFENISLASSLLGTERELTTNKA
jgi:hypothetical protein